MIECWQWDFLTCVFLVSQHAEDVWTDPQCQWNDLRSDCSCLGGIDWRSRCRCYHGQTGSVDRREWRCWRGDNECGKCHRERGEERRIERECSCLRGSLEISLHRFDQREELSRVFLALMSECHWEREGREREIGEERIFSSFVFSVQLSCISRVYHLKANSVDRHLAHSSNIWKGRGISAHWKRRERGAQESAWIFIHHVFPFLTDLKGISRDGDRSGLWRTAL